MTQHDTYRPTRSGAATVFAVLVAVHGAAHFAGFASTWRAARDHTSKAVLAGAWHVASPTALKMMALGWAVLGVAMIAAAVLILRQAKVSRNVLGIVALASLAFSVLWIWAAVIGVLVNLLLLAIVRRDPAGVFPRPERVAATVDRTAVARFLAEPRIALVGASGDPRKFGNTVFRALRDHGYDVVPVSTTNKEIDGVACVRTVAAIDGDINAAMVMVPGTAAVDAVRTCGERGIQHIWLFRGLGAPGAMSDEAMQACAETGADVVAGACPMMFLEPAAGIHNVHLALRRFAGAVE